MEQFLETLNRKEIRFYRKKDGFFELTNFAPSTMIINNIQWISVEQYYQAQKVKNTCPAQFIKIIESTNPGDAARLGRSRDVIIDPNWDNKKDYIMYNGLINKFSQDETLRSILISTKNAKLIENSPVDYYWGCGRNGLGKNQLGFLLEIVRDQLR